MSKLRSVNTAFWSDPFVEELTPYHKLLFLYIITNEKTNMLGIYEASISKMAFETGLKKEDVRKGLSEFEKLNKVKYIGNYVVLVNYMKHQKFNTNMKKSAIDIYNSLPKELKDSSISVSKEFPDKGFLMLSNHYGMVSKDEVEGKGEDEVETKDEVEEEILLCSLSEKDEPTLGYFDKVAWSFWKLFKTIKTEEGLASSNLDKAKLSLWSKDARLMVETDKRTKDQMEIVWKHVKNDTEFWRTTVSSMSGVRKNFETIFMAAKKTPQGGTTQDEWDTYYNEVLARMNGTGTL